MRKLALICLLTVCALFAGAQTQPAPTAPKTHKEYSEYFLGNKDEILRQSEGVKKIMAQSDSISNLLDTVLNLQLSIEKALPNISDNPELAERAEKLIDDCDKNLYKKLTNPPYPVIMITTDGYLHTLEEYKLKLGNLLQEINTYLSEKEEVVATPDESQDLEVAEIAIPFSAQGMRMLQHQIDCNTFMCLEVSSTQTMIIICSIVLFLLAILGVIAFFRDLSLKKRLDENERRIGGLVQQVTYLQSLLANLQPVNQPAAQKKSKPAAQTNTYDTDLYGANAWGSQSQTNTVRQQPVHQTPKKPKPEPVPTDYRLYATLKAGAVVPEFFKISPEASSDKIFVLTLPNVDSDTATFSIATGTLSAAQMKETIENRDTYLPNTFCETRNIAPNPTSIEVLSPGKAKKVDGKWMVADRVVINLN